MKLGPTHITVIVVALIAAIVTLSILNRDTAAMVALLMGIGAALGIGVTQNNETRQNVNGNMSRLVSLTERMANRAVDEARAAEPLSAVEDKAA